MIFLSSTEFNGSIQRRTFLNFPFEHLFLSLVNDTKEKLFFHVQKNRNIIMRCTKYTGEDLLFYLE